MQPSRSFFATQFRFSL